MQHAVLGHDVGDRAALRHDDARARGGPEREGREHLAGGRVVEREAAGVVRHEDARDRALGAGPVVAAAGILVLPAHGAVPQADGEQVPAERASLKAGLGRVRPQVEVAVAHERGRDGLLRHALRLRQRVRKPDGLEAVRRERLDAAVVQRHHDDAVCVGDAAGGLDPLRQRGLAQDLAGGCVAHLERVAHGDVDVSVHDNRVALERHPAGSQVLLPQQRGARGCGVGRARARAVRTLVGAPLRRIVGARGIRHDGHVLLGKVLPFPAEEPLDPVAWMHHVTCSQLLAELAVHVELPPVPVAICILPVAQGRLPVGQHARGRTDGPHRVVAGHVVALEDRLRELRRRGAGGHARLGLAHPARARALCVGAHDLDGGRHVGLVARGKLVAAGGVVPDHAVAVGKLYGAGTLAGGLAIHEQLPVAAGRLVVPIGLARGGRRDGVEVDAVAAVLRVVREARCLEQALREVPRRRAARELDGAGGPGLGLAKRIRPDDRARHLQGCVLPRRAAHGDDRAHRRAREPRELGLELGGDSRVVLVARVVRPVLLAREVCAYLHLGVVLGLRHAQRLVAHDGGVARAKRAALVAWAHGVVAGKLRRHDAVHAVCLARAFRPGQAARRVLVGLPERLEVVRHGIRVLAAEQPHAKLLAHAVQERHLAVDGAGLQRLDPHRKRLGNRLRGVVLERDRAGDADARVACALDGTQHVGTVAVDGKRLVGCGIADRDAEVEAPDAKCARGGQLDVAHDGLRVKVAVRAGDI